MFNFKPENVITEKILGKGKFGKVYPYRSKNDDEGEKWAVKEQRIEFHNLSSIIQEITLGFTCLHPNILPVKGFYLEPPQIINGRQFDPKIYIKMPRMVESLRDILNRHVASKSRIEGEVILKYFHGISCGLMYLHEEKIAHMDIKPDNILVDNDGVVKIADVGLALFNDESSASAHKLGGTLYYAAPEVLGAKDYKLKKKQLCITDMWSLGTTIAELCSLGRYTCKKSENRKDREKAIKQYIGPLKNLYSSCLIKLISNLLKWDPDKRIKIRDLVEILEREIELKNSCGETFKFSESKGKVEITTINPKDVTDEKVYDILLKLKQHIVKLNCQNFTLNLDHCTNIDGTGLKDLPDVTKGKNIKTLCFTMNECENLSDDGIKAVKEAISGSKETLQSLTLNLNNCKNITESNLDNLVDSITTNLENLQALSLWWDNLNIKEQTIMILSQNIPKTSSNLSILLLSFDNSLDVTDASITDFAHQLKNLTQITDLTLSFGGCKSLSDKGIKELISGIGLIHRLGRLNFNVSETNVGDLSIQELNHQLVENLKSLTCLELYFIKTQIKSEHLKTILNKTTLNFVEHIRLDFSGCNIDEETWKPLAQEMSHAPKLTSVEFFFENNQLSQATGKSILESLPKIKVQIYTVEIYKVPELWMESILARKI